MIPLHDDNPTERTPVVTIAAIATCVLVFFYQASLPAGPGETFVFQYGAIPALVFGEADPPEMGVAIPAYATLITSMFLHGGWMHLIGNMLYLWVFGNNIEDVMGHGKYIAFYLTCGILAALSHALTDPSSSIPRTSSGPPVMATPSLVMTRRPGGHAPCLPGGTRSTRTRST
ncbi:MAG TPA: rhomboid family intramembrane serine protease [Nitrospiraceae bacterium]|nr:rhomboid family intramembrane serine protease [Nitrospiraceae bacterium]